MKILFRVDQQAIQRRSDGKDACTVVLTPLQEENEAFNDKPDAVLQLRNLTRGYGEMIKYGEVMEVSIVSSSKNPVPAADDPEEA